MESFLAVMKAGETLFASCRDESGLTSVFAPCGLDALDRTSSRILRSTPSLRSQLHAEADAQIERYFDHLDEDQIRYGEFDMISIARGEMHSPAWIAGKLLAMGLIDTAQPALDPVLHPETRCATMRQMEDSPLSIAIHYATALLDIHRHKSDIPEPNRHTLRLRIAAAEALLQQLDELTVQPHHITSILDHLDRGAGEAGAAGNTLISLSFAGHSRLHMQKTETTRSVEKTGRN